MQPEGSQQKQTIYYLSSFSLFSSVEGELLSKYKYFIENVIIKLGEDWRIESNLLAKDIIAERTKQENSPDLSDFSLFNEFLSSFLKGKIGKEQEICNMAESMIEQNFLQTVNAQFLQEKIHGSLTFKTLSLGYCITATEVWNKAFRKNINQQKQLSNVKLFGTLTKLIKPKIKLIDGKGNEASTIRQKLENIQLFSHSSQFDFQSENIVEYKGEVWRAIQGENLSNEQINQIKNAVSKIIHPFSKIQIFSYFACYVDQIKLKNGKIVRIFSLAREYYMNAFIVWLIFNIKMFFSLNFNDYLRYFKQLLQTPWKNQYERPLKKFQMIIQRQWNKLLKDYTVALHDDLEVLNILIDRMKKEIERQWQAKLESLQQKFTK